MNLNALLNGQKYLSMKVNVIFLDYLRKTHSQRTKNHNFGNAGYPFDFIEVDMKGISAAINYGIDNSKGYDAIVVMANDILLPNNWLFRMVEAATLIPDTGMAGIHCVEGHGELKNINTVNVRIVACAFGSVLHPMKAVRKVGYYNTDFDPYSFNDADYAYRLNCSGFINYYIEGLQAEHIGHDVGDGTEYRKMKDESLKSLMPKWTEVTTKYNESGNYTIDLNDWPDAQD